MFGILFLGGGFMSLFTITTEYISIEILKKLIDPRDITGSNFYTPGTALNSFVAYSKRIGSDEAIIFRRSSGFSYMVFGDMANSLNFPLLSKYSGFVFRNETDSGLVLASKNFYGYEAKNQFNQIIQEISKLPIT